MKNANPEERLLRLPEVRARTGLSRSAIYAQMASGRFPKPARVGVRAVAWPESAVSIWIQLRVGAVESDRRRR